MATASTSKQAMQSPTTKSYDVAIVGAGIVGAALAYSLGRSGRRVVLLERDLSEPDRIVGELLQPGGIRALGLLDLLDCLHDIDAVPVQGYHVFYGERSVPIPYPEEKNFDDGIKGIDSGSGKVEGRSFHHGKFVQRLRKRAMEQPNVTTIEATVKELLEEDGGKVVGVAASRKDANGEDEEVKIKASLTIVVDGCFSKFRRTHGSTIQPIVRSNFVALELEHAPLPSPQHGHVVLGPSGPTLLYQISTVHTRILIDVGGEKLPSASKGHLQSHIRDNVLPHLPKPVQPCLLAELDKGQRLRSMPNSFLPPSMQGQNAHRSGVILVGDAMNMRHPLTGGGMSVGLWDVVYLTNELGGTSSWRPSQSSSTRNERDLQDWASLKPALRSWHWLRKSRSSAINILAQALYSLFGASDENLEVLRQGCFAYFEQGGECVGGPVRLLSGLTPDPMLLVYHFFSVAILSIVLLFREGTEKARREGRSMLLTYPRLMVRSVLVFWTACVVLFPVVFSELRSNVPTFKQATNAAVDGASTPSKKGQSHTTLAFALFAALAAAYLYSTSSALTAGAGSAAGLGPNSSSSAGFHFSPIKLLFPEGKV